MLPESLRQTPFQSFRFSFNRPAVATTRVAVAPAANASIAQSSSDTSIPAESGNPTSSSVAPSSQSATTTAKNEFISSPPLVSASASSTTPLDPSAASANSSSAKSQSPAPKTVKGAPLSLAGIEFFGML